MTGSPKDPIDRVTPKQRELVHGVLEGKTLAQATIDAGYVSKAPGKLGSENLRKPDTLAYFRKCLAESGLTPEYAARKMLEGIETASSYGLSKFGDSVELGPDWHARAKLLDMAVKAMGGYPDPRIEQNVGTQNVLVIRPEQSPLAALDPFSQQQDNGVSG